MYDMWCERGHSDTRLLQPPLIPDDVVIIGSSKLGAETKEHIIPRKVIVDKCHQMFRNGQDDSAAKTLIQENVRIIYISKKEAQTLNNSDQLNLRQCMPSGWTFETGDKYARIKMAGIEWE